MTSFLLQAYYILADVRCASSFNMVVMFDGEGEQCIECLVLASHCRCFALPLKTRIASRNFQQCLATITPFHHNGKIDCFCLVQNLAQTNLEIDVIHLLLVFYWSAAPGNPLN